MQTLNDHMKLPYRMEIVEDQEEGGYVLSFPELPGCITCGAELPGCITCGETLESALKNADDAKKAWLQAAIEEELNDSVYTTGGHHVSP